MLTDPVNTTIGDLCNAALRECGALGVGQTPLSEDVTDAWARAQFLIQQWERKRWLVYHLVTYSILSTGAVSYTVGPGGDIDTGFGSVRPSKIESGFSRQIQITGQGPLQTGPGLPVDYVLSILPSMEDYNRIVLKNLTAGPGEYMFYDASWPLGRLFVYPIPQANIYEIHPTFREQLPTRFPNLASQVVLPYEYYAAILYNLAVRLRPKYRLGSYPGDPLPGIAKDSMNVIRSSNAQVAKLTMPSALRWQNGRYNIFSDRSY